MDWKSSPFIEHKQVPMPPLDVIFILFLSHSITDETKNENSLTIIKVQSLIRLKIAYERQARKMKTYKKNKYKLSFLYTINRYFNTTWYYDVMMRWKGSIYMFFIHWLYADLSRFTALLIVNYNIVYMFEITRVDHLLKVRLIIISSLQFVKENLLSLKNWYGYWTDMNIISYD